jgi:hypothetical protein
MRSGAQSMSVCVCVCVCCQRLEGTETARRGEQRIAARSVRGRVRRTDRRSPRGAQKGTTDALAPMRYSPQRVARAQRAQSRRPGRGRPRREPRTYRTAGTLGNRTEFEPNSPPQLGRKCRSRVGGSSKSSLRQQQHDSDSAQASGSNLSAPLAYGEYPRTCRLCFRPRLRRKYLQYSGCPRRVRRRRTRHTSRASGGTQAVHECAMQCWEGAAGRTGRGGGRK